MNQILGKTFILLLLVTFSSVWISDQFAILENDKKYDFYEKSEKNSEENNLENKTKTLYLVTIESISCIEHYTFEDNNINSSDLFKVKEYALKNTTPPPKQG
jgi:hypothetical protein